jgi:hypothetical protein
VAECVEIEFKFEFEYLKIMCKCLSEVDYFFLRFFFRQFAVFEAGIKRLSEDLKPFQMNIPGLLDYLSRINCTAELQ